MGHAMSVQKSGAATSGKGLQVKLTNVDLWRGFKLCEHFIRVSRLQAVRIPLKKKGSSSLDAGGVPKLFGLQPTLNNMTVWMRDTFLYVGVLRVLWLNHGGGGAMRGDGFFYKEKWGICGFHVHLHALEFSDFAKCIVRWVGVQHSQSRTHGSKYDDKKHKSLASQ